jgi:four helix bundle protein
MKENIAKQKSILFSLRIIKLCKHLADDKKEYIMSKQILRSGTSIGANLAEAECAISKSDFLAKVYISLKECSETLYWLELLYKSDYLPKKHFENINKDCQELKRILMATTKTMKGELKVES